MQPTLAWLSEIPREALPVLSAAIAAVVAVAVALVTQFVLGRREVTKMLIQKLEELYLQTLLWQDERTIAQAQFEQLAREQQPTRRDAIESLIAKHTEQTAHRRISMYIDFYFPGLRRYSRQVFEADRQFELVIKKLEKGEPATVLEMRSAAVEIQRVISSLLSEIQENRTHLTKMRLIAPRYRLVDLPPRRSNQPH
jgi:non-homologous end joining protein Ku